MAMTRGDRSSPLWQLLTLLPRQAGDFSPHRTEPAYE